MTYIFDKQYRVSSSFTSHKNRKPPALNPGTDYATPTKIPIFAPENGIILSAQDQNGSLYLTLNGVKKWQFVHLSKVLKTGRVAEGEQIAWSGNSGGVAPHTHVTIFVNGKRVDPEPIINSLYKPTMTIPQVWKDAFNNYTKFLRPDVGKSFTSTNVWEKWIPGHAYEVMRDAYNQFVARQSSEIELEATKEELQKQINSVTRLLESENEYKDRITDYDVKLNERDSKIKELGDTIVELKREKSELGNKPVDNLFIRVKEWLKNLKR